MPHQLPATQIELLDGRYPARDISEALTLAYWMHSKGKADAEYHWDVAHTKFAELADALGYTIAIKEAAFAKTASADSSRMRDALESLSNIHDRNPSDEMCGMTDAGYARHMLGEARAIARSALGPSQ